MSIDSENNDNNEKSPLAPVAELGESRRTSQVMMSPDEILRLSTIIPNNGEGGDDSESHHHVMSERHDDDDDDDDDDVIPVVENGNNNNAININDDASLVKDIEMGSRVVKTPEQVKLSGASLLRNTGSSNDSNDDDKEEEEAAAVAAVLPPPTAKPARVGSFQMAGYGAATTPTPGTATAVVRQQPEQDDGNINLEEGNTTAATTAATTTATLHQAIAVSKEDLEAEVRSKILRNAVTAQKVIVEEEEEATKTSIGKQDQSENSKTKQKNWIAAGAVFVLLVVIIIIAVTVGMTGGSDGPSDSATATTEEEDSRSPMDSIGTLSPSSSSSSSLINSGEIPPLHSTTPPPDDYEYDYVYVISMSIVNFCGHNTHRAHNECGGYLASMTSPNEKEIVDGLAQIAIQEAIQQNLTDPTNTDDSFNIQGIWIGGEQYRNSRNDTHNGSDAERDVVWYWVDPSAPWFDNDGEYWMPGEPDNTIIPIPSNPNVTKGEHATFWNASTQLWQDVNGCHGAIAPKAPGIYILPKNYDDAEVYPNCRTSPFLRQYDTPVPPRPNPTHVYVVNMVPVRVCGHTERVLECGGALASITSIRDKAILDQLTTTATKAAPDYFDEHFKDTTTNDPTRTDGVWIGGTAIGNDDDENNITNLVWGWTDDSTWFDNEEAYWQGGRRPNLEEYYTNATATDTPMIHTIMLTNEGVFEQDINEIDCQDVRAVGIYILPFDYKDRTKYPDCRTGDFTDVVPVPERQQP